MPHRKIGLLAIAALVLGLVMTVPALGTSGTGEPQLISDASLKAVTTTIGGAQVLSTTRTVAHWWGSTANPDNGITYGYNMVGADPNSCSGSACDWCRTAGGR